MSSTSSPAISERSLQQTLMSIHFLIIGGGAAGLCSAVTLSRIGHKVTLLEASDSLDETPSSAGAVLPPNMTKLLMRWGIEEELYSITRSSPVFRLSRYENGDILGMHTWDDDLLQEIGGDMRTINYGALRKLLKDAAVENGVTVRTGARATSIELHSNKQSVVTLVSGETISADVVIGADGLNSIARKKIVEQDESTTYMGHDLYHVLVPGDRMLDDPELKEILDEERTVRAIFGSNRCAIGYSIMSPSGTSQAQKEYVLNIVLPGDGTQPRWGPAEPSVLLERMGECDQRTKKIVGLASMISGAPVVERPRLENWIRERLLVIGDAAHVFYPCSVQNLSVAVCDAATLGHLFQHLHHSRQIDLFLAAFQGIRQERIEYMRTMEFDTLYFMMIPDGLKQEERDKMMRDRYEKGLNALDSEGAVVSGVVEKWDVRGQAVRMIFSYDAEEEADKWWAEWGSLQERAAFDKITPNIFVQIKQEQTTIHEVIES